jgi:arylsulfatase A-like enzyme
VHGQVRNLDVAPTLLDLAGVPAPPSFEGRSLLPLALGEEPDGDRPSFAALGQPLFADARVQHAYTDGTWTYARNLDPGAPVRELLFDRRVDPAENVNLADIEPEQAHRLAARLDAHLAERTESDDALRRTGVHIDPAIAERLRALGYLGDGTAP